jgi:flagellar biosynthesis/type III secretory pathway protein FliH
METPLPTDPNTIVVTSAASDVTPSDLVAAITTVQAATAASREHATIVEAQQEQAAMAVATATTSGVTTASTDLVAALAALQACVATAEAEAQQVQAVAAALEL